MAAGIKIPKSWTISEKEYIKLRAFIDSLIYRKDRRLTKFARKYGINSYADIYKVFKTIKKNLKSDNEGLAFGIMKDMAKTFVGRIWVKMPGENDSDKTFNAWSFTLDMIALALDNLNILREVLAMIKKQADSGSYSGEG